MLYRVAEFISMINYHVNRTQREAVLENMRVILGPGATDGRILSETKSTFKLFGRYLAEFFGLERFGGLFLDQHAQLAGREHLDAALASGKGAILNSGHLSNWELGASLFARLDYPVMGVALVHPEPAVNDLFRRQRASRGYYTIPSEGAYRPCLAELKANRVVCFVADWDIGIGGVEVEFFGRPTLFPQGPARIALASGAPLLPTLIVRRPNSDCSTIIEPPIPVPAKGNRRAKAQAMTQDFARIMEKYVRAFPAQWGVFHKYWSDGEQLDTVAAAMG